jgi:hypothetical protein
MCWRNQKREKNKKQGVNFSFFSLLVCLPLNKKAFFFCSFESFFRVWVSGVCVGFFLYRKTKGEKELRGPIIRVTHEQNGKTTKD